MPTVELSRAERQKERGYRQERRIVALLETGPLPARKIAARLFMSVSSAQIYLRRLREARKVYVCRYEQRAEGAKPGPVYALGDLPDAVLVVQPRKLKGQTDYTAQRKQALLDAMEVEPRTARALAGLVKLSVSRVQTLLRELRCKPGRQVYITRWEPPEGRGDLSPVYAIGNRPDAQKPRMTRAERYQLEISNPDKRNRRNARRRAAAAARRSRAKPVTWTSALGL